MNCVRGSLARPGFRLAAFCVFALSASAFAAQPKAGRIQLELNNTPIATAIGLLMRQSGAQIVVSDPPSIESRKVTVSLSDTTVDAALNSILTASNIPWYRGEDGVYYINAQPPVAPVQPEVPAPARMVVTEKIELRNQSPSMIIRALGLDDLFPLDEAVPAISPVSWSSPAPTMSISPAAAMGSSEARRVTVNGQQWEIWDGNAYRVPATGGASRANKNDAITETAGREISEPESAGQIGFPRGGAPTTGRGRGTQPGTGTTGTAPGGASQTATTENQRLIPDGIDVIFPYQEDNSLLVRGEPDSIDELKNIIALLDVPVKQVSIKAEFVTVSVNDLAGFGFNWSITNLNSSLASDIGGGMGSSGPTLTLAVAQGNVEATLNALKQQSRARTIQAPLISTLNNVPAQIQTSRSYPIFQPSVVTSGTSSNIVTYSAQYVTASTQLQVIPRVNRDGSVTVQIYPQVQDFGEIVEGPNNIQLPTVNSQALSTVRRVKSGDSIVLGGLATKKVTTSTRGIPILDDLPLIGWLFRSKNISTEDSQLLIFLTPTIVQEDQGAVLSAG